MDAVCLEIGIHWQHVAETSVPYRFQVVCDKRWLQTLEKKRKIASFPLYQHLDRRAHPDGNLDHPWIKVLMQMYKKYPNSKAYPLLCKNGEYGGANNFGTDTPLSYSQTVFEVAQTNFRNIWEQTYETFPAAHLSTEKVSKTQQRPNNRSAMNLLPYDVVLRDLIQIMYRCPVIHCQLDREKDDESNITEEHRPEPHSNIMPAVIAIETSTHFAVLFYPPCVTTTLYDCITYSPAVLNKTYNKPLFIIYQILQLTKFLHQQGLLLGVLCLQDILLKDNCWIWVIPKLDCNIALYEAEEGLPAAHSPGNGDVNNDVEGAQKCMLNLEQDIAESANAKLDLKLAYDLGQFSLRDYCELWCNGQLSNFHYLTVLNNAAGRSTTNPSYHHIMPWVTDFTTRSGSNWRDLTKSKYRLSKGDIHLDLMFSQASNQTGGAEEGHCTGISVQVPHHVSDFLSEITYFVYMARRTPQHILREHVRPIWVPAEYPVSIQRLQEWTPDECIPEFYTDPMIFKSIHEDLPDLELPTWASCPEDFISKHREALESQYVSERLQHWIDLNFGYKLTGKAAIKSKNVCLSVVDQHKQLCRGGIVQLFIHPHPPRRTATTWFSKTAPRVQNLLQKSAPLEKVRQHLAKSSENLHQISESLDKLDSMSTRSVDSSNSPHFINKYQQNQITTNGDDAAKKSTFYQFTSCIELPKDYNPLSLLQSYETMCSFIAKTFPSQERTENAGDKLLLSDLLFENYSTDHSFTNELFNDGHIVPAEALRAKLKSQPGLRKSAAEQMEEKYRRDHKVLGCLIVELFAMARLRPLLGPKVPQNKFEERLKACLTIQRNYKQDIPKCVSYVTSLLLGVPWKGAELITEKGLPSISVAQILEPIYYNILIPFPVHYYACYALVRALKSFDYAATLLELYTHFDCDGLQCSKYKEMDCTRVLFQRKIAECKVMSCYAHLGSLLETKAYDQFPAIEILLPHIIDLLTNEQTSILTAWNLLDSVAQSLGIAQTQKLLLQPVMKLYDVESFERGMTSVRNLFYAAGMTTNAAVHLRFSTSSSFKSRKSVKLYHHSFLLRLIVRFGSRCFLHNFIAPLIEAVGGYKEPEDANGLHYHSASTSSGRKIFNSSISETKTNKESTPTTDIHPLTHASLENLTSRLQNVLPMKVKRNALAKEGALKSDMEDVFSFDDDESSDTHISNSDHISNKSLDLFDARPTTAEEAKEDEEEEECIETTPEKKAISEIFYGSKISISNNSLEEPDQYSVGSQNAADFSTLHMGPCSPTIPMPPNLFKISHHLNTIDCDIGSRKSIDSVEIMQSAVAQGQPSEDKRLETAKTQQLRHDEVEEDKTSANDASGQDETDFGQRGGAASKASLISQMSEAKSAQNNRISEMSSESLIWLSHRLGPVLTCRFITKNLLKMLSLCYVGQENLLPESAAKQDLYNLNYFSISDARVVGDRSAARVLECLMSIAALYGEHVILLQYFPHITELIASGTRRITSSLEGAIISTLQLVKYLIPCLLDATVMEHLKDLFLDSVLLPVLTFLSSSLVSMPSGYLGRSVLTRKFLDAVYVLCVRLGADMSREHLCLTIIRPFFLIFDKAFEQGTESEDPLLPPPPSVNKREKENIRDVFSIALAHSAYLAFLPILGEDTMKHILINFEFIITLCHEFEQPDYKTCDPSSSTAVDGVDTTNKLSLNVQENLAIANSFGTQIVGNRIEVTSPPSVAKAGQEMTKIEMKSAEQDNTAILDMVAYKFEHLSNARYLKGNWLAYWRHEITRSDKDSMLNLKQIKLQSFVGHTNSVRGLVVLDNENSFISASKDKTVKLWSLRSEGDGSKHTSCQFTYTAHKKSIHSMSFLESMRLVVSCDSGVHLWDPFIGRPLAILDSSKHNPITVVKCLPSPSNLVLAGTAEASVKIIDARCMQYVNEWRIGMNTQTNATVRCVSVAPSGNWMAVGLSSGSITTLDTRTGIIMNSWRPMECDLLQLAAPNDQQLISSALDHSLAVWHAQDGILHYQLMPPAEPAHFLQTIGSELVYATTGNRIGIYSDLSNSRSFHSVTKLRSETFKGVLTSLAVLPLNRTFLVGNESGNISLLC